MRGGKRTGAGRKKGFAAIEAEKARELIAQKLSTNLSPIVDKAIKQAKLSDRHARIWLIERASGKTLQIEGNISYNQPRTSLTEERLLKIAEFLLKKKSRL